MKTLKKIFDLLTEHERTRGVIVLIVVFIMSLLETLGIVALMPFLALVGDPSQLQANLYLSKMYDTSAVIGITTPDQFLLLTGLIALFITVISSLYKAAAHQRLNQYIEQLRSAISFRVFKSYLSLDYEFFAAEKKSRLVKTIISECDELSVQVMRPVFYMLTYILVAIAIVTVLIIIDPWVCLIAALVLVSFYVLLLTVFKNKFSNSGECAAAANEGRYRTVNETFATVKYIKSVSSEEVALKQYISHADSFSESLALHQTLAQVPKYIVEAVAFGGMIALVLFMLPISDGESTSGLGEILPLLGVYALSAYRLQPAIQIIYAGIAALKFGYRATMNIHHAIGLSAEQPTSENNITSFRFDTAIIAKGISYRHREASAPALKSLNFSIPKGAAIGIVGPSGAGKTTLVDVLMAILAPSSGALIIDNVVISEQNASHWRRLIGYVPQEVRLIDGSIAENIAFTTDRSKIDLGRVKSVSKIAQLHDFIKGLPNGYSTQAGELGARLSGGQQQRVAIARALYREPEVLILDEATSALDPITEAAYRSALAELRGKCTSIQVAHRVATLRDCDMILVLDKGLIVDIGTYEELVEVNNWFQQASKA